MNTTHNPQHDHDDGELPPAVVRADDGADAWVAVVRHQRQTVPDHADFYALAGATVSTVHALQDLTRLLGGQVAGYGQGRPVYDDSRTVDPAVRLAQAALHLGAAHVALAEAGRAVNEFWSAISHIGVEDVAR